MIQLQENGPVAGKSLIYLVSGMSEENKTEMLESALFAQMGAKTRVSPESDAIGWYKAYNDTLSKKGWTIEGGEVQQFASTGSIPEIENAITGILMNAFGGAFVPIADNAIDAIRALAAATGENGVYEKNRGGSFQIAVARQDGKNLSINLGTLLLSSSNAIRQMLFLRFSREVNALSYLSGKMTPDQIVYEHTRKLIQQKLSEKAAQLVKKDYLPTT